MSDEIGGGIDLSSLGSFDFTPDWAKSSSKVSVGSIRPERDGGQRPQSGGDRPPRKSPGDQRQRGGGKPPHGRPAFGKPQSVRPAERQRPLDVEVKILPETKALGTIIRKLQNDIHAYKLKDLAYFFLDNPESVLLKITPRDPQSAQTFFQCKACGFASTSEDDVVAHAVAAHLPDYYDAKEIETEPPKGNFNCIARCGLSGVLLGPPNMHEFNDTVREMVRTRFPQMSEGQYRAKIEMVRDADAIEQWQIGRAHV